MESKCFDDLVLVGGGGHALSVADSILGISKYRLIGYTDNTESDIKLNYCGTDDFLQNIYEDGVRHAAVGVGYLGKSLKRDELYKKLVQIGYELPVIVDSDSSVSALAVISEGTFVGKRAVVNANSIVGKMCIINTSAIVEHGNRIGDFSHISVGAVLGGDVTVGNHTLIGANATVIQGVTIGMNCIIGAGSLVLNNVPDNMRVVGIWGGKLNFILDDAISKLREVA